MKDVSDRFKAKLNQLVPQEIDIKGDFNVTLTKFQRVGLTWGDLLEYQTIQSGCKGQTKALAEVLDRVYGKVPQVNHNENKNFNMTYPDFLSQVADDEAEFQETGLIPDRDGYNPDDQAPTEINQKTPEEQLEEFL